MYLRSREECLVCSVWGEPKMYFAYVTILIIYGPAHNVGFPGPHTYS